jgi:hypothetical protein
MHRNDNHINNLCFPVVVLIVGLYKLFIYLGLIDSLNQEQMNKNRAKESTVFFCSEYYHTNLIDLFHIYPKYQ